MKKFLWIVTALITLAAAWAACSKNSSNSNSNSRVSLMTQAIWKYDTSGIDLNKDGTIDIADTLQACFKDNTYQFNKDSTGILNEGAIKCNSTDPQTSAFSWTISSGNPAILKSDVAPILAEGLTVLTLSSTKLTVYKDTTIQGIGLWYIFSLKH
jgi:hypothetical protein